MRRLLAVSLSATVAAGAVAVPASGGAAAPTLLIYGGGSGHGVGMSQYGAYGYALHGLDYQAILAHYYTGTTIGQAPSGQAVRVLMDQGIGSVSFSGAGRAAGHHLSSGAVYQARAAGRAHVTLAGPGGAVVATVAAPLVVTPAGEAFRLYGTAGNGRRDGRYRGSLLVRPDPAGGLDALDVVGLDDYARGVVAAESDPSWPTAELEAQAVAVRTYAITDTGHAGFDVYADTRSQLYEGVAGETPATDKAVAMTARQVVNYEGRPVITFYFDTSGGETEDIQNAFPGSPRAPWLVSVPDPYDSLSPRHRYSLRMTMATAQSRLGALVRGTFERIVVTRRGASPRIVKAVVVGSGGSTPVSGQQLAASLHLPDTWACFAVTGASGAGPAGWSAPCMPSIPGAASPTPPPVTRPPVAPSGPTGGAGAPPGG